MNTAQAGFTTIREFNFKHKARREGEQSRWELARWQQFISLQMQPFIKPHSKPKDIRAWITFPWEKEIEMPTIEDCRVTEDEVQQLDKLLRQFQNRHK